MTEFEQNCYGMSREDIREQYIDGITGRISGPEMVVMSILSDCQELIAMNSNEQARKELNRAKYILSKMLEEKSSQVA